MHLFNIELADFVRQKKDGSYVAVEWPKDATHQLVPTSWNVRKLYKPNGHGKIQMPKGFALSVCAVPLTRKFVLKGTYIKAKNKLPEGRLCYKIDGSLEGKKIVLEWMVEVMEADVKDGYVESATNDQCDSLYRNLIVAHNRI